MAITFDKASTAIALAVDTITWLHTATGANLAAIMVMNSSGGFQISTTGLNNAAMTVKAQVQGAAGGPWAQICIQSNVAAGTLSMSCTLDGADDFVVGECTYAGVAQAMVFGAASTATATGTVLNLSVSTAASGLCFAFCGASNGSVFTDPQTTRFNVSIAATVCLIGSDKATSGSTTSFSWSVVSSLRCVMGGIALSATAIAGGTAPKAGIALTGAGQY